MTDSMVAIAGEPGSGVTRETITLVGEFLAEDPTRQAVVVCPLVATIQWERLAADQNVALQAVTPGRFVGMTVDKTTVLVIDNDAFYRARLSFDDAVVLAASFAGHIIWTRVPSIPGTPSYRHDRRATETFRQAAEAFQVRSGTTIEETVRDTLSRKQLLFADLLSD